MVEINWTPQSIFDIDNIAEFIAKDSEKYAIIQTKRFFEAAEILNTHPKAGRIVPEIPDDKIRELKSRFGFLIMIKSVMIGFPQEHAG